jgi:hypothetical protein
MGGPWAAFFIATLDLTVLRGESRVKLGAKLGDFCTQPHAAEYKQNWGMMSVKAQKEQAEVYECDGMYFRWQQCCVLRC